MIYTTIDDLARIDRKKSVCFTGHRPDKFTEDIIPRWAIPELKAKIRNSIMVALRQGYDTFYTGMQRGVDIWAAKEVLFLKKILPSIRLICISPYANEINERKDSDRADYEEIKAAADGFIALAEEYANECYRKRNYFMVDHSSLLIGVFCGQQRSGTAQTIRYAQRQGLKIDLIDPSKIAGGE